METALIRYRSEPTNRNFSVVYDESRDWIRAAAASTVRQYRGLTSADFDDVANEGLLSLANAARRFVYFCPRCGDAFLRRTSLVAHGRDAHRVRGAGELVSIAKFSQVNARLAMKRTARRMLRPGEVLLEEVELGASTNAESTMMLEYLVRGAVRRLSAEAERVLLEFVLGESSFEGEDAITLRYVRARVAAGLIAG